MHSKEYILIRVNSGGVEMKNKIKLKSIREEHSFTMAKLSDLSGIPQTTISGYENEGKMPSLLNASKLAKALNISLDELLKEPTKED